MKRLTRFLLMGIIAIVALNCGGSGKKASTTPADIEKAIFEEFKKGNVEKGLKIFFENCDDADMTAGNSDDFKIFADKAKRSLEGKGGIKSFVINETISEDGETATVFTEITYGNGEVETQESDYLKVDGKWKTTMGK